MFLNNKLKDITIYSCNNITLYNLLSKLLSRNFQSLTNHYYHNQKSSFIIYLKQLNLSINIQINNPSKLISYYLNIHNLNLIKYNLNLIKYNLNLIKYNLNLIR